MASSYIFDAMKGETAQSLARKRAIAEALMGSSIERTPRNVGEGIASIGRALAARMSMKEIGRAEQAGRAGAEPLVNSVAAALNGSSAYPAAPGGDTGADVPSQRVAAAHAASGDPETWRNAVASIESAGSGDYAAIGPTDPELGRPLGRYQVMEGNLPAWTQETFGRHLTAEEFLADPKAQDAVFDRQFGGYVQKFGSPEAAAHAWFAGPGGVGKTGREDALGTSVGEYGQKFAHALRGPAPGPASGGPAAIMGALASPMAGGPGDVDPNGGGPNASLLFQAMGNDFVPQQQKAVIQALLGQKMQAGDPATQLETEYKRAQIDALRNKQADLPAEVDEYNFYAGQEAKAGRQPLPYNDWRLQGKKAGATTVSVNGEPGDGALRKKLDEKTGELWSGYQQTGATSAAMSQDMEVLDDLIKIAPQGPVTGRLAETFSGFSSAGDAFQAIVKRVAPTLRAPGSGATSDIEYDGMLKSLPRLSNKPEANAMISAMIKAKAALNIERSAVIDEYRSGRLSSGEASARMAEIDKRSIMTPEMRQTLIGIGAEPVEVDGYKLEEVE